MLLAAVALGPVALGSVVFGAAIVRAAPAPSSPSGSFSAATTSPPPPAPTPAPAPEAAPIGPKGSNVAKARMWATSLSNMVVYENGSGYLYGFWRQFGENVDHPARLYWGRPSATAPGGCPDVSDRVYHILQEGFARQDLFYLVVDRDPDPRQPGAYCVRGVELEARVITPLPSAGAPPAPTRPPATPSPSVR